MKLYNFCHSIFSSFPHPATVSITSPKENVINSTLLIEASSTGTINSLGIIILLFLCLLAYYIGKKLLKQIRPDNSPNYLVVSQNNKMRKTNSFHTKEINNEPFQKVATLLIIFQTSSPTNHRQMPKMKSSLVKESFHSYEGQNQGGKELSCILLLRSDRKWENHFKEVLSVHFHTTILEDYKLVIYETKYNIHNMILIDETYSFNIKKDTTGVKLPMFNTYKFKINLQLLITCPPVRKEQALPHSNPLITSPAKEENKEDLVFIQKVNNLLEKNLTTEKYTIKQLNKDMIMSRTSFYNRIKDTTGMSPSAYIFSFKMKEAKNLLANPQYNVTDITFLLGYNDAKYFGKKFKEYYHMCPTQYRKEMLLFTSKNKGCDITQ